MFPDFDSVENHLNSLINYEQFFPLGGARDRPKLDPTYQAVERLGLQLRLPKCIHIAGTKGKGSAVSFLESLTSPRHATLSFTSPHLVSVKERIRLNGKLLDDAVWQKGFEVIVPALAIEPAIKLTYFEMTFVFYLWAARQLNAEFHIVEAGLGGRWDATNVLEDTLAVLMPVDYDHTEVLGHTLAEIATDKSGIIKPDARAVVSRQPDEALKVYQFVVQQMKANARFFGKDYRWISEDESRFAYEDEKGRIPSLKLRVSGDHQKDNAATALCAARIMFPDLVDLDYARERLAQCEIPGRQQFLSGVPDVLLDVAHNPVSFRALADTLRQQYSSRRILAIIGMMRDKDARGSLEAIAPFVHDVLIVEPHSPRAMKQKDLIEIASSLGMNATCPASLDEAFAQLHQDRTHDLGLIAGSFYLAGDYLLWRQRAGIA
jgi:dihydrofolate synthase / folylpolyglutamate synthase